MSGSKFCPNVGKTDQALRILVGLVLIALVFVGPKTPIGWIGLVPLLTGLFRFCPLYPLIKLNTCSPNEKSGGSCCCGGGGKCADKGETPAA